MNKLLEYLKSNDTILYVLAVILLFPALFINLGLLPLITDEPTRAIVSLEMIFSDNYIVPTINGQYYYNKPPLYNWILILSSNICGGISEFSLRLPTVISLLLFGSLIFLFVRRNYGNRLAILNALIFISCGRILFWDSYQGLIDIFYSAMVFLSFMLIYHFYQVSKFYYLFLFSYLLTAVGFLLKGMPSLMFQAITLLVFFVYMKTWKKLFSGAHLMGILLLILILGSYYYSYSQYNSLEKIYTQLYFESSQRTIIGQGFLKSFLHIFTFPIEMLYHFAPWTLLLIGVFRKGLFKILGNEPFIKYLILIFIFNITFYWISPATHPRYLFMLFPLLFIVLTYFYYYVCKEGDIRKKILDTAFLFICILLIPGIWIFPFLNETKDLPFIFLKTGILSIIMMVLTYLFLKLKNSRLIIIVIMLLCLRIAFNIFLMPNRSIAEKKYKNDAIEVGKISSSKDLLVYWSTPINHDASFYISRERGKILKRSWDKVLENTFYLVDDEVFKMLRRREKGAKIKEFYTFDIKYENTRIHLIQVDLYE